ncbi:MAG: phosphoglycerate kinase [Candidatus Latescibacteria bacterium]|nr:phosphoglycerate kinase [Candidatus Latescibacterota bacterium]
MNKLSILDLDLAGKRVLMRVDFNVPIDEGRVGDDTRLRASLPTIQHILDLGGHPVLMSHLGRPKGEAVPGLSLKPIAEALQLLLGREVIMAPDCIGPQTASVVKSAPDGAVVLLENLRFHPEEEDNAPGFAMQLAELGDVYVNDAFGTAHRAHASTEGVTHYFVDCAAGLLLQKELDYLGAALAEPERPFVAIMGGAKISGKIDVIEHLFSKVDTLLIGGGMAFTFFKAMGLEIGNSLLEEDRVEVAAKLIQRAKDEGIKLLLPMDTVVAADMAEGVPTQIVARDQIPADLEGFDVGTETRALFVDEVRKAKTVIWNGPLGVSEIYSFSLGTRAVAQALVEATENGATTIVGGGETAAAVADFGAAEKLSHVSTGGGASLEFLEGKTLPGVAALSDKADCDETE